jgi:hypothetical protein
VAVNTTSYLTTHRHVAATLHDGYAHVAHRDPNTLNKLKLWHGDPCTGRLERPPLGFRYTWRNLSTMLTEPKIFEAQPDLKSWQPHRFEGTRGASSNFEALGRATAQHRPPRSSCLYFSYSSCLKCFSAKIYHLSEGSTS